MTTLWITVAGLSLSSGSDDIPDQPHGLLLRTHALTTNTAMLDAVFNPPNPAHRANLWLSPDYRWTLVCFHSRARRSTIIDTFLG